MNTYFPDQCQNDHESIFNDLRQRLVQEAPAKELADLLESVNAMQRAQSIPEEYDLRFEEFVYRAEEYMAAVRPFFPALVAFLSARRAPVGLRRRRTDGEVPSDAAVA